MKAQSLIRQVSGSGPFLVIRFPTICNKMFNWVMTKYSGIVEHWVFDCGETKITANEWTWQLARP